MLGGRLTCGSWLDFHATRKSGSDNCSAIWIEGVDPQVGQDHARDVVCLGTGILQQPLERRQQQDQPA